MEGVGGPTGGGVTSVLLLQLLLLVLTVDGVAADIDFNTFPFPGVTILNNSFDRGDLLR